MCTHRSTGVAELSKGQGPRRLTGDGEDGCDSQEDEDRQVEVQPQSQLYEDGSRKYVCLEREQHGWGKQVFPGLWFLFSRLTGPALLFLVNSYTSLKTLHKYPPGRHSHSSVTHCLPSKPFRYLLNKVPRPKTSLCYEVWGCSLVSYENL